MKLNSEKAHLNCVKHSSGRILNTRDDHLIPNSHLQNSHFPTSNGYSWRPGMAFTNYNGWKADAISKKTWEENISTEKYLESKAKCLAILNKHYAQLRKQS